MGRYDSELRSHPSARGNVFQLHPCRLTPPFMILHRCLFLSTCHPPRYTFSNCAPNSTVKKKGGSPPRWLSLTHLNHDGPASQSPCRVPAASKRNDLPYACFETPSNTLKCMEPSLVMPPGPWHSSIFRPLSLHPDSLKARSEKMIKYIRRLEVSHCPAFTIAIPGSDVTSSVRNMRGLRYTRQTGKPCFSSHRSR